MASFSQKVGYSVWGGCIAAGTTLGLFAAEQEPVTAEYQATIAQIDRAEELGLEHDLNYDRVVLELGEGCFALVNQYLPEGPLEETPESDIVDDVLQSSTQPCGENATEARRNVRELFDADQKVRDNHDRTVALEREAEELQTNPPSEEVAPAAAVAIGLGGGVVVGAIFGFFASVIVADFSYRYDEEILFEKVLDKIL